jgi:anti-sigma28 factor (negative regulator of flagellin synthesis)
MPAPVSMARPRESPWAATANSNYPAPEQQPIDHAKVARLQAALQDGTLVDVLAIANKIVDGGG